MRPPKAAALPLIDNSHIPTKVLEAPSAPSMRAVRFMEAPVLPVLSVPLPSRRNDRALASTSVICTSPLKDIVAGPTLVVTVPLYRPASTRSVIFAPGMQAATASTFCRNSQAISAEHGRG